MIYGIGRNYGAVVKDLGKVTPAGVPLVFFKPDASIVESGKAIRLPPFSNEVQHEVELAFRFGDRLEISEICVANDLTARDKIREAQEAKAPWTLGKGFKQSCGLGPWIPAKGVDLANLELKLLVNGELKQRGFTKDMIFNSQALAAYLIETFPVVPGDICLTGTPSGIGAVKSGDEILAEIVGYSQARWTFV